MKKILLVVGFVCLVALSSVKADAKDMIRPPEDLKSLMDKIVVFEDTLAGNTFVCRIAGVSKYRQSMGEQVTLSVTGLNYHEEVINKISYTITSTDPERWELTYHDMAVEIVVKSIE